MAIRKAGVVFQRRLEDYFDPTDDAHIKAWETYLASGKWPEGFITPEAWVTPTAEEEIRKKLKEVGR